VTRRWVREAQRKSKKGSAIQRLIDRYEQKKVRGEGSQRERTGVSDVLKHYGEKGELEFDRGQRSRAIKD